MDTGYAGNFAEILGGFVIGLIFSYYVLKHKVEVVKRKSDHLILKLPFIGELETMSSIKHDGIFVHEWEELRNKTDKLSRLLDPELVYRYARQYKIKYIGFEGDRPDGTWSEWRLASIALNRDYDGGYKVHLNPHLDLEMVSRRLSEELGEEITPEEVPPFLFLHEIGHTTRTGNHSYFRELTIHSLSGGRHSAGRMRALINLKKEVEKFADQYALNEIRRLRSAGRNS